MNALANPRFKAPWPINGGNVPPMMEDNNFDPDSRLGGEAASLSGDREAGQPDRRLADMAGAGQIDSVSEFGGMPTEPFAGDSQDVSSGAPPEVHNWDKAQLKVIKADCDARVLVDAGPGTGKTAVACARLEHLINEEMIEPSNTWMISFTRTAVAEIRNRLEERLGGKAFSVGITTIDSRAWKIHSGYVPGARFTEAYDENIKRVIKLMESDDSDLKRYLSKLEHVVIDEAQDVVGERGKLIRLLINGIDEDCGVTVFADEAQAIYGFSVDEDSKQAAESEVNGRTLLEWLQWKDGGDFNKHSLCNIHRTSSPELKKIFSELRAEIIDPQRQKPGLAKHTAARIRELAHRKEGKWRDRGTEDLDANSLVLFRSRVEVLLASQGCGVPHCLRLSGYGATLPSWLALCFSDFVEGFLTEESFVELWSERVQGRAESGWTADEAWKRLLRIAGKGGDLVEMGELRRALCHSRRPPVELASAEYGLRGPIMGTIHASKGREADKVILLLPFKLDSSKSIEAEAEDARVLFVGATRARTFLSVGTGSGVVFQADNLPSDRIFFKTKDKTTRVEVGRQGDIAPSGLVGKDVFDHRAAADAQNFLAVAASDVTGYALRSHGELGGRHAVVVDSDGPIVGVLETKFTSDLSEALIANKKDNLTPSLFDTISTQGKGEVLAPQGNIEPIRGLGCSTLVLSPDHGGLDALNEPWASSGFLLAPRIAAFPEFKHL